MGQLVLSIKLHHYRVGICRTTRVKSAMFPGPKPSTIGRNDGLVLRLEPDRIASTAQWAGHGGGLQLPVGLNRTADKASSRAQQNPTIVGFINNIHYSLMLNNLQNCSKFQEFRLGGSLFLNLRNIRAYLSDILARHFHIPCCMAERGWKNFLNNK